MQAPVTMEPTLTISWSVIGTLAGIFAMVVGVATAYLRMFISIKMAELKVEMLNQIKAEFASKERFDEKAGHYETRISKLEKKVFKSEYE